MVTYTPVIPVLEGRGKQISVLSQPGLPGQPGPVGLMNRQTSKKLKVLVCRECEALCTPRSPEKPGVLSMQDCPFKGKDIKPVFPSRKLGI